MADEEETLQQKHKREQKELQGKNSMSGIISISSYFNPKILLSA